MEIAQLQSQGSSETSDSDLGGGLGPQRRRDDLRRGRLNAELLTAVLNGDIDEVKRSLDAGASVNATCRPSLTTALQLAVACGFEDVVILLLGKGADARRYDVEGRQAVHLAAVVGNPELLRLLLDFTEDKAVNTLNTQVATGIVSKDHESLDSWSHDHCSVAEKIPQVTKGATPLHLATQRGHLDCVNFLLEKGARVDLQDNRGLTPLDVVGEIQIEQSNPLMIEADAFPFRDGALARINSLRQRVRPAKTQGKSTKNYPSESMPSKSFLRIATSNDPIQPRIQSRTVPFERTPDFPPKVPPSSTFKSPSVAQSIVNSLIDKGAELTNSHVIVKAFKNQGEGGVQNKVKMQVNCLHTAIEQEDLDVVELLLDNGACQLTWNSDGLTPLHLAVVKRLLEPLRILLEKNKSSQDVDARDLHGRTPLHLAVALEWFQGVGLLLEAGADVKVTSNDGHTVLHLAAAKNDAQLLEELLKIPESIKIIDSRNNIHATPLCSAVCAGQLPCVNILLAKGADITVMIPGDITLLHLSAERGHAAILERLLKDSRLDKLKNVRTKGVKGGANALHYAALGGYVNCVESLIKSDCDVYGVTSTYPHRGSTPLHLAAMKGHTKVVEVIVKHRKDTLNVKNDEGWYPLHVAARFSKTECIRFMLLNGANLGASVYDSVGNKKTAFDIIVYNVLHPVTFIEKIFDYCIEVNDYPLNSPKCEITLKYGILQPLGPDRKQMKVLDALLNCGKGIVEEKLILHPLVETFLFLKWKKLRIFFFLIMVLYMIFTVSLTTMAMSIYVLKCESAIVRSSVTTTCRFTLCFSLTVITLQELVQATRMQRYYLKDLESWMKWSSFLLASVVVLGHHPADWLVHVSAIAVLFSWIELLFLLSRLPSSLGFYILMFFTVAKNVLMVLATFLFFILGFTFAFMILFKATGEFSDWWRAFVKVMVMTIEFEYESMFEDVTGINGIVSRGIFLSFMVLVAIVLMNLLVGLAVSDISILEKKGRARRLAKQIDFLSMLEMFVYNRILFSCCPKKLIEGIKRCRAVDSDLKIEPGRPLQKHRHILTESLKQSVINNIVERKNKTEDDWKESVSLDDTVESNSSPEKPSKEGGQETKSIIETQSDEQIIRSLQQIINELSLLRQEIESIKTQSHQTFTSVQPQTVPYTTYDNQSHGLSRT